jgi:hypothetical protein
LSSAFHVISRMLSKVSTRVTFPSRSWLRDHARKTNCKLAEIAAAVVEGHGLLPIRSAIVRETGLRDAEELFRVGHFDR